jgi:hypothetical protein
MTTRRHVLQLLAAAPALSACGGGNAPDPAAAWRDPGAGAEDPRRFALAHAILAPNPHNTQPWIVELDGDQGMTLWCDLERRLPFTDPNDRQITLGCGAFLYLYWISLYQRGLGCQFEFFPEGEPGERGRLDGRPLAHARIIQIAPEGAAPNHYFEQVLERRTNRNPYNPRAPERAGLTRVVQAATDWAESPPLTARGEAQTDRVAALRDLVWRAFDRELRTPGAQEETYRWLRFGRAEIAEHRDGLAIDAPMAPLLRSMGFLDREDFLDPDSMANKQAAQDWRRKAESAQAFAWLSTPDDAPVRRLIAGMAYARMNLAATSAGLAMHPWSQALQEYEAMADLYAEARQLLESGDGTLQMLVRVGYAEPVGPAARRGVEAVLRG